MIDIGMCSYRNPEKLKRALESIHANTVQPFSLTIWHNTSDDAENDAALRACEGLVVIESPNVGYAIAVNGLLAAARSEYFLYCDNDIEVQTRGWDERFSEVLDNHAEVAQVFPGAGHYGFFNGRYHECLWNAGYCWLFRMRALKAMAFIDALHGTGWTHADPPTPELCYDGKQGPLDPTLGHHEEVDLMIRLRLAGFQIACVPSVKVLHHETATQSDLALHQPGGRIHDGVVRWMNKWNQYFCGDALKYSMTEYDPRALRYTDWPPCALYLERWTLAQFPFLNAEPKVFPTRVGNMDGIISLKPTDCYRKRAI